jgi:hypothetical protein
VPGAVVAVVPGYLVPNWKRVLQLIEPDALLHRHPEGFRPFWKLKSRVPVQARPHQGAAHGIPAPMVSPPRGPNAGKVMAFPVLNVLHHDFCRAAAQAGVGRKSGRMKAVASTGAYNALAGDLP